MRAGREMGADLVKKIKTSIRVARSARHVPAKILQVGDVPVTLTGKKVEGGWRRLYFTLEQYVQDCEDD